ncbi:MAG TPA: hypothetical protein VK324_10980, partial [Tepidisphaeraceae bacterium]|nr:hypothetical protein [Tepidisphaeraceae bacterium]
SPVVAPWWNWVPFDLVANLLPFQFHDRQKLHYALVPEPAKVDEQAVLRRAEELQEKLKPSTRPAR